MLLLWAKPCLILGILAQGAYSVTREAKSHTILNKCIIAHSDKTVKEGHILLLRDVMG